MKTLYIIRHAKSSWNFDLPDKDRPLGLRGRRDVLKIGKYLSQQEYTPDLMISSTASRALYTALYLADEWSYPEKDIAISEELYHASLDSILETLAQIKDVNNVAIFGHNPGFTELVNQFSAEYVDNLSTCAVYAVQLDISTWADILTAPFERKFLISPKRMPNG